MPWAYPLSTYGLESVRPNITKVRHANFYPFRNISKSEAPRLVWIANLENPVSVNVSLKLTSGGGLVLKDADGSTVWSTNISSKSVASLNLTKTCNLMLLDDNNATIIWQSFDHPTDTLVLGQ